MNSVTLNFMGQDYVIPTDIKKYLDVLQLSEQYTLKLIKKSLELLKSNDYLIDPDTFSPELRECAEAFVKLLCENDIFSKTADDYMMDNSGYDSFIHVNQQALETRKKYLLDDIDQLQSDIDRAYNKAASNITGTGWKVYSSSFLTLAANAAYEYSVIKKQCNQADEQYNKELNAAMEEMNRRSEQKTTQYTSKVYIPGLENSITQYVYEILDKFINDMISNGKMDSEVLNYINISRSESLLRNCSLTPNKTEVIKSAFVVCPFNVDIYIKAIELSLFDVEMCKCSEYFGCKHDLIKYVDSHLSDIYDGDLATQVEEKQRYFLAEAILKGTSKEEIYQNRYRQKYKEFIAVYAQFRDIISDSSLCKKDLLLLGDSHVNSLSASSIKELAQRKASVVKAEKDADFYFQVCGFRNIWEAISPKGSKANSIKTIENEYAEKLYEAYSRCLLECKEIAAQNINRNRQAEIDRKNQEEKERKKETTRNAILNTALIVLLIVPVIVIIMVSNSGMESVKEQVTQLLSKNIERELADPDSSFNKERLTGEFDITNISFYGKSGGADMLVPTVVFHSNKSLSQINLGYHAVSSVGSEIAWVHVDRYLNIPSTISKNCSVYFNSWIQDKNGEKEQIRHFSKDYSAWSEKSIYFTWQRAVIYSIYAVIVLVSYKKLKSKR